MKTTFIKTTKIVRGKNINAVNLASRLESSSEPGKVQISEMTRMSLGDGAVLSDRGEINLKNKGPVKTYFLQQMAD